MLTPERPVPLRRTWLRNTWRELTFVHWAVDPAQVQRLLPMGLTVDTFDGDAYVSLIPFEMNDASPRGLPAVPWLSRFAETNVRTYVVDSAGNRAIWFFSLEAARLPIVLFAKGLLGFPYVWSTMSIAVDGSRRRYETTRRRWPRRPPSTTVVEVDVGDEIVRQSDLDVFLTARWGTVARWGGTLRHHPVDHPAWTLHDATLIELDDHSVAAGGIDIGGSEPIVRWAAPIDATFGRPSRV